MGFSLEEQGLLFTALHGLLTVVASLVSELGLLGSQTSVGVACGLSICGSWALQHRGSIRVARRVRISFLPLDSLE